MDPKKHAFIFGALEALGVGFVAGVYSVWATPNDIILSKEGLVAVATIGIKVAVVYLIAFLRQNMAFRSVWTEEQREEKRVETEEQRREKMGLPPKFLSGK